MSQRTLILFKPDAVQRRLCGQLLDRIERKGLSVIGMKLMQITSDLARQHYAEHVERPFYPGLEAFITSGPVVALAVEGPSAITIMRTLMGATNGAEAAPGTMRGDFGCSKQMNLVHGSDGEESATRELALYFSDEELFSGGCLLDPVLKADDE